MFKEFAERAFVERIQRCVFGVSLAVITGSKEVVIVMMMATTRSSVRLVVLMDMQSEEMRSVQRRTQVQKQNHVAQQIPDLVLSTHFLGAR